MSDYSIRVGKRINESRKNANMTMKELGKRVGLSESSISKYEKGQIKSIDVDLMKKIAKELNVNSAYLCCWDDAEIKKTKKITEIYLVDELEASLHGQTIESIKKIIDYSNLLKFATQNNTPNLNAAHMNENATEEEIQHDNDIMDDDSEW